MNLGTEHSQSLPDSFPGNHDHTSLIKDGFQIKGGCYDCGRPYSCDRCGAEDIDVDAETVTHWEVRWKLHRSSDRSQARTSIQFSTLELAQREAERVRNRLFVEVDGFRPFVSAVNVWRVVTRTVRTQVEEPILVAVKERTTQ